MIGIVFATDRRFQCLKHCLEKQGMHLIESMHSTKTDFVVFGLKGPDQYGKIQMENGDLCSFDADWFSQLPHNCLIVSYVSNNFLKAMAERFNLSYWAMEEDEALAKRNAQLTAEACISEIIARRPFALSGSRVSLLGYGRIARALIVLLQGFHIDGTVVLRNQRYDSVIRSLGYQVSRFEDDAYLDADVIINTVPAAVLHETQLEKLDPHTMLVELASFPYGFDSAKAMSLGLEVALLPSLPSKYAYASSANAMAQALCRQLEKRM